MKLLVKLALVGVALFVVIQLVPYGRRHHNPRVVANPTFATARGERLVRASCYDCHSNETTWPWYTNIAPISWWSQNHVDEGRAKLNFSTWNHPGEARGIARVVEEGSMPPSYYVLTHPSLRLSAADKQALISELRTIAASAPPESRREGGREGGGDDG